MQIENQVISLELAKRLCELGVKQESLFYWIKPIDEWQITPVISEKDRQYFMHSVVDILSMDFYSAFTVSELLELLPANFKITNDEADYTYSYQLTISKCDESEHPYCVWYYSNKDHNSEGWQQENDTLPNCLAKMLIYLIEEGHVKL